MCGPGANNVTWLLQSSSNAKIATKASHSYMCASLQCGCYVPSMKGELYSPTLWIWTWLSDLIWLMGYKQCDISRACMVLARGLLFYCCRWLLHHCNKPREAAGRPAGYWPTTWEQSRPTQPTQPTQRGPRHVNLPGREQLISQMRRDAKHGQASPQNWENQ